MTAKAPLFQKTHMSPRVWVGAGIHYKGTLSPPPFDAMLCETSGVPYETPFPMTKVLDTTIIRAI